MINKLAAENILKIVEKYDFTGHRRLWFYSLYRMCLYKMKFSDTVNSNQY